MSIFQVFSHNVQRFMSFDDQDRSGNEARQKLPASSAVAATATSTSARVSASASTARISIE